MITKSTYRALFLVKHNQGITGRDFGLKMWPDTPRLTDKKRRCCWLSAGGYLAKLQKRKFIFRIDFAEDHGPKKWSIASAGLDAMKEFENYWGKGYGEPCEEED
jgi:hypothetical protein